MTLIFHSQKNDDITSPQFVKEDVSSGGEINLESLKTLIQLPRKSLDVYRKIYEGPKLNNEIRGKLKANRNQQKNFENFIDYREKIITREYYCWKNISNCHWYRFNSNINQHYDNNRHHRGCKLQSKQYSHNYKLFPTLSESRSICLNKYQEFHIIANIGKSKSCESMNNNLKGHFKSKVGPSGFRKNS